MKPPSLNEVYGMVSDDTTVKLAEALRRRACESPGASAVCVHVWLSWNERLDRWVVELRETY